MMYHAALYLKKNKKKSFPIENVINDGATSNETRIGAIGDIQLVIEKKKIDSDCVIIAGDTLFFPDDHKASFSAMIDTFSKKDCDVILSYNVESSEEVSKVRDEIEEEIGSCVYSSVSLDFGLCLFPLSLTMIISVLLSIFFSTIVIIF